LRYEIVGQSTSHSCYI